VALTWLEANCAAARNVQAEAERCLSVERQGTVDLEEMVMSTDLNGAITSIGDFDGPGVAAGVDFNRSLGKVDRSDFRWFANVEGFVGNYRRRRRRRDPTRCVSHGCHAGRSLSIPESDS